MSEDLSWLMDLDRAIHEPGRLLLVALLAGAARADFAYLLDRSGLTKGNLASHMRRLEEAGYVAAEKRLVDDRARTLYRLTDEGRRAWKSYRKRMRTLLG